MPEIKDPAHSPLGNDPLVGAQFGPYRIIGRIADGERGEIYFAEAPEIQRKVAVKVLREEYCRDQEALKEFHAEIKLIKELAHENIAEVYDVGWTTDKRIYIIMERLQGETLQDRIDRGPLSFQEAIIIIGQTLIALTALHQKGVIHRDLRPDRIFLSPRPDGPPKVKLLGLGISRLINLDDLRKRLPKLSATSAGAVAAHYLSPEQIVNKPVDARTDLFALGIIIYETFAGQLPFAGVGVVQVLAKQAQGQIPPLPELDPNLQVPPEVRDVVAKATKRDPQDRFPDATRFLNVLTELADSRGVPILPPAPKRSAPIPAINFPMPSGQQLPVVAAPMGYQTPAPGQPQVPPSGSYAQQPSNQYPNQQYQTPYPPPAYPQNPLSYTTPHPGQPSVPAGQSSPMGGYAPPVMSPSQQYQYPQPNASQSAPPGGYAPPVLPQGYQPPQYPQQPAYPTPPPQYDPRYTPNSFSAQNQPPGNFLPNMPQTPVVPAPPNNPSPTSSSMGQWGAPAKKSSNSTAWVLAFVAALGLGGFWLLKGSRGGTTKTTKTQKKELAKNAFAAEKINETCLPIVRKALDSSKPTVKARAIEILGNIQDSDRISDLRARVTDKDPNVRAKAAKALAQVNDKAGISKLQELRKTADTSTQVHLDEALLRLGDKEAEKRVEEALTSKDVQTQLQAALTLADLGDRAALPVLKKLAKANLATSVALNVQGALARLGDDEALYDLTQQLQSKESALRVFAAEVLYKIGYSDGQEPLHYIFTDKKSPFLLPAARALARPGNKEIEDFLVEASQSKNPTINLFVAEGLGKGAQEEASMLRLWGMLEEVEGDEEQMVAISGALLQIQSRSQQALQKSATQWAEEASASAESSTRLLAAEVLAVAKPSTSVTSLLEKALQDQDPTVAAMAARSLGALGQFDVLKGSDAANPIVAVEVGAALLRGNDSRGSELLAKAFASKDELIQTKALTEAAFAGDPSMARGALDARSPEVRFAAALALAAAGDEAGQEVLLDALKKKDDTNARLALFGLWLLKKPQGESGDPKNMLRQLPASLRPMVVRSLYKRSSKEILPVLQLAITDSDVNTRRAAILAMSRYADSEQEMFKPFYLDALLDLSVDVRAAAAFSLVRIAK